MMNIFCLQLKTKQILVRGSNGYIGVSGMLTLFICEMNQVLKFGNSDITSSPT